MKSATDTPVPPPAERHLDDPQAHVAGRDDCAEDDLSGQLWDLQMEHWRAGMRIPVEAYLRLHPELDRSGETTFELVFGEVLHREAMGEAPGLEEFLWRFPWFADRLRRQFEIHRALWGSPVSGDPAPDGALLPGDDSATEPGPEQSAPGFSVPGHRILSVLGRGGMGIVYKSWQISLRRLVALKVLDSGAGADPRSAARFQNEAEAVARFHHPNIIQIYELGEFEGLGYLVIEYAAGGSLRDRMAGTPQDPRESARMLEILAHAVHYAHQCGIVHRDLKPANVLLSEDGVPKIADFGLAKLLEYSEGPTRSGDLLGTPSYMAPEQAMGRPEEITPATDIYALGVILYEMLTGQTPFRGATPLATIEQIATQDPLPPGRLRRRLPRDLETICLRCLEKDRRRRYASAGELALDLGRFLDGRPIMARPISAWGRTWRWARRKPGTVTSLASLGLAAVLVVAGVRALREAGAHRRCQGRRHREGHPGPTTWQKEIFA